MEASERFAQCDADAGLELQRANLDACVRCGLCLEKCPTYALTHLEEHGPRGRIVIAKALLDGHLDPTPDLIEAELSCLTCEACTAVCPAGVRMEPIQVAVRAELRQRMPLPRRNLLVTRSLRVLGDWPRLARWIRALRLLQRLGVIHAVGRLGLLRRIGLHSMSIPDVPKTYLAADGGGWRPRDRTPNGRVLLFTGCVMSTLLSPVTAATGELLAAAGWEVERRRGQTCCGALAAHEGDHASAEDLARRNVEAFNDADWPVVVNSAGCGTFLKRYGDLLGASGEQLANRVVDLAEFLVAADFDLSGPGPKNLVVYQDACHARLAQGIVDAPRQLLSRITGLQLTELNEAEMCCGSAGVYSLLQPERGTSLGTRKANDILATGAATVITGNPGCLLQLRGSLHAAGARIPVMHLAEVLRHACPIPVEPLAEETER